MDRQPAPELPTWLAEELPFDRYCVDLRHGDGHLRMHVMEAGPKDGQPVLLLHGNPTWGYLYRKVARALDGAPLRLIMPDLIGLGFSDKPRDAGFHTLDTHQGLLGQLIDGLNLPSLIFVGQDWGGPIGLAMLAHRPKLCAGLVIMNTVVGPPKEGFKATLFHRFSRWPVISTLAFRVFGFPQVALHTAQGDKNSIRGQTARAYKLPLRGWKNNVAPLALARMVPDSLEHPSVPMLRTCQDFVEGFEGPSAVVWGKRDPVLGRLLKRTQRALPKADVTVTEAGHFLQEEVPAEIAAAVRRVAGL